MTFIHSVVLIEVSNREQQSTGIHLSRASRPTNLYEFISTQAHRLLFSFTLSIRHFQSRQSNEISVFAQLFFMFFIFSFFFSFSFVTTTNTLTSNSTIYVAIFLVTFRNNLWTPPRPLLLLLLRCTHRHTMPYAVFERTREWMESGVQKKRKNHAATVICVARSSLKNVALMMRGTCLTHFSLPSKIDSAWNIHLYRKRESEREKERQRWITKANQNVHALHSSCLSSSFTSLFNVAAGQDTGYSSLYKHTHTHKIRRILSVLLEWIRGPDEKWNDAKVAAMNMYFRLFSPNIMYVQ